VVVIAADVVAVVDSVTVVDVEDLEVVLAIVEAAVELVEEVVVDLTVVVVEELVEEAVVGELQDVTVLNCLLNRNTDNMFFQWW